MDWKCTAGRPIWQQLKERVAMGMVTGEYPPGSKLPSVRDLAAQAGVNPNTMQRALMELERDELAQSQGTVGRTVTTDLQKLEEIRRGFAKDTIRAYLDSMALLGYGPQEAQKALEEWDNE